MSLKKRKKLRFFMLEELSVGLEASPGALTSFVRGKKTNMTDQKKILCIFFNNFVIKNLVDPDLDPDWIKIQKFLDPDPAYAKCPDPKHCPVHALFFTMLRTQQDFFRI